MTEAKPATDEEELGWDHIEEAAATDYDINRLWLDTAKQPEASIIKSLIVRVKQDRAALDAERKLRRELQEALHVLAPDEPGEKDSCHYLITTIAQCWRCSRILNARAALAKAEQHDKEANHD